VSSNSLGGVGSASAGAALSLGHTAVALPCAQMWRQPTLLRRAAIHVSTIMPCALNVRPPIRMLCTATLPSPLPAMAGLAGVFMDTAVQRMARQAAADYVHSLFDAL
jgi:hypothetical protein